MANLAHEHRRLVESLRIMLAIIAGMLMLQVDGDARPLLSVGVIAFSFYAGVLLWHASHGSLEVQHRSFYWLDVCWFLLLMYLSGDTGIHYFVFLLFPIFFAAWRTGYRESVAIAVFGGLGSLIVLAINDPEIPWRQLLALPFSLFVIAQVFVVLARIDESTRKKQALASEVDVPGDTRQSFDAMAADILAQVADKMNASIVILALRTSSGSPRAVGWDEETGVFQPSAEVAAPLVTNALSLPDDVAVGWRPTRRSFWWQHDRQIEIDSSGLPAASLRANPETLRDLAKLAGPERLLSVPLASGSVGRVRLLLGGASIPVNTQTLSTLHAIAEQIGPSVENACLREELATQAADAERARIGRDLHDSAIQPYIGLKFAVEAIARRVEPENPIAPDLARLKDMVTGELTRMRDLVSGLRGDPHQGGTLLSGAIQRHAARFGQLFDIDVAVDIESDLPISRRLAGEVFHMVAEGLSNIGRHTQSRWARVSLVTEGNVLVLRVSNANASAAPAVTEFSPRSLTERAAELGGSLKIERNDRQTMLAIRLPLPNQHSKQPKAWTK